MIPDLPFLVKRPPIVHGRTQNLALSGADIMKRAKARIFSGTLYPMLARLEESGWLSSSREGVNPSRVTFRPPRRRLYRITALGQNATNRALAAHGVALGGRKHGRIILRYVTPILWFVAAALLSDQVKAPPRLSLDASCVWRSIFCRLTFVSGIKKNGLATLKSFQAQCGN